jgi:hypothetical protein
LTLPRTALIVSLDTRAKDWHPANNAPSAIGWRWRR